MTSVANAHFLNSFADSAQGGTPLTVEQLKSLARYGTLAPTSHNTVPQRFCLDAKCQAIHLWLDPRWVLQYSDPEGREGQLSIGCVAESIMTAASCAGYATRYQLGDSSQVRAGLLYAGSVFVLQRVGSQDSKRLLELEQRKVVRSEYDESRLPSPKFFERLRRFEVEFPEVSVSLVCERSDRFKLAKLDEQATKFKLENKEFREELGAWLRPNSAARNGRGMRGEEFGFDDDFAETIHEGLLGKAPLAVDQLGMLARGGRVGILSSPLVLVIHGSKDDLAERIAAGRLALRASLDGWRDGLRTAWHTAACEVPHVRAMFSASLLDGASSPLAILRFGVPLRPNDDRRSRSGRPDVETLLL